MDHITNTITITTTITTTTTTVALKLVQGYYESEQTRFVSGNGGSDDVDVFEPFFDENATADYRLTWPYSNPNYTAVWERFDNKSHVSTYTVAGGNAR